MEPVPRWLKSIIISFLFLFVVDFGLGVYVSRQSDHQTQGSQAPKNKSYFPGPVITNIGDWLECFDKEIVAASTAVLVIVTASLAVFTGKLWGATNNLVERTEWTTKTQERAYLYGGGPYGLLNPAWEGERSRGRESAKYYEPPWCMAIYNYGRTPGTVTKVEWGLVDLANFPRNTKVTTILKNRKKLLPPDTVTTVEYPNFICPPTEFKGLNYRHVMLSDRKPGQVFFARIDYEDVFGDPHYSTFKLLFAAEHSDPMDGGYDDQDYQKPPKQKSSSA